MTTRIFAALAALTLAAPALASDVRSFESRSEPRPELLAPTCGGTCPSVPSLLQRLFGINPPPAPKLADAKPRELPADRPVLLAPTCGGTSCRPPVITFPGLPMPTTKKLAAAEPAPAQDLATPEAPETKKPVLMAPVCNNVCKQPTIFKLNSPALQGLAKALGLA